jgi:hypothetical protein
MLVSVKQAGASADEATSDKLSKEYQAWLQSTAVADAKAEIEGLQVGVMGWEMLGFCMVHKLRVLTVRVG